MPRYSVEVAGEYTETVYSEFEIEAEDAEEARDLAISDFYEDNYGAQVVDTYVVEELDA